MIACAADGLIISCRVYNVQSKTVKMRRDETIMPTMPQEECYLRGIQKGFQMETVRGGYVRKQTCTSKEGETRYGWDVDILILGG